MNETILKELKDHSQSVFDNLNIELSGALNDSFQKLLRRAVERMDKENRISEDDIRTAKKAVTIFINQMYTYRKKRFNKKDLVLYIGLLESRSILCPLWPIC